MRIFETFSGSLVISYWNLYNKSDRKRNTGIFFWRYSSSAHLLPALKRFGEFDSQFYYKLKFLEEILTLFRMEGAKSPPTSFSTVTSLNVRIIPKTFWLLVLILLPHRCKILSPYLVPVPNYWTWTKTTPQKKWFFWSNPYKIELKISSLIEML